MTLIKQFQDGSTIETGRGSFDDWCIYLTRSHIARHAPKDVNYFQRLIELSEIYTSDKIYSNFIEIYRLTNTNISSETLDYITQIASQYDNDKTEIDILFTILYLGMVAEENKENTKLGKRIKRLGIHQILVDKLGAPVAANFSRNMRWYDILAECKKRGF